MESADCHPPFMRVPDEIVALSNVDPSTKADRIETGCLRRCHCSCESVLTALSGCPVIATDRAIHSTRIAEPILPPTRRFRKVTGGDAVRRLPANRFFSGFTFYGHLA